MIKEDIIILCGGAATRLMPVSDVTPKSLIVFEKVPFIEWQIRQLKSNGFENIILAVGHLSEKIVRFIIRKKYFGLNIRFSPDGDVPLGTGGAVKKASEIAGDNFFVMNGDSYLDLNYAGMLNKFYESDGKAMMAVYKNNGLYDRSNTSINGGKVACYDKNGKNLEYIDYGISVFNKSVFTNIREKIFDMEQVNIQLIKNNELFSYEVHNRFYEIGSFQGINDFKNFIKGKSDG